ncbi:hypothetical protein VIGAN_08237300, partial [Vigna angularis var. angularis]
LNETKVSFSLHLNPKGAELLHARPSLHPTGSREPRSVTTFVVGAVADRGESSPLPLLVARELDTPSPPPTTPISSSIAHCRDHRRPQRQTLFSFSSSRIREVLTLLRQSPLERSRLPRTRAPPAPRVTTKVVAGHRLDVLHRHDQIHLYP